MLWFLWGMAQPCNNVLNNRTCKLFIWQAIISRPLFLQRVLFLALPKLAATALLPDAQHHTRIQATRIDLGATIQVGMIGLPGAVVQG